MAVSAFLLFQVQLCLAKFLLPWFGGSPAVWSTSMAFFQVTLTLGYAWSAWLAKVEGARLRRLQTGVLALGVVTLLLQVAFWHAPLLPSASLKPGPGDTPIGALLLLLAISVGVPFFVLSTNGTLQQAVFARRYPGASPYRLYALSNLGSLVGLLCYPFVVERTLALSTQAWAFLVGFLAFAAVVVAALRGEIADAVESPIAEREAPLTTVRQVKWLFLAGVASALLVSTTSRITSNVAAVPFLWMLPLALYLLTFVLTFESDRWYRRLPAIALMVVVGFGVLWLQQNVAVIEHLNFFGVLGLLLGIGFLTALVCHGELARSRPSPASLGRFYLLVSIGGSLGTIASSFIAPVVTVSALEMPVTIALAWVVVGWVLWSSAERPERLVARALVILGLASLVLVVVSSYQTSARIVAATRNFHGQLKVERTTLAGSPAFALSHGLVLHGQQFVEPQFEDRPTAYYIESSGVGKLLTALKARALKVGVIGLGAGVLAAYCKPGDTWTFYEIDPDVVTFAKGRGGYFRFLSKCAESTVVVGDGRSSLAADLRTGPRGFDVIVVDAFSGDSIPLHLLTREAFELYRQHLAPHGFIAFHTSNLYLELEPPVVRLAEAAGLTAAVFIDDSDFTERPWGQASDWVVVSDDVPFLRALPQAKRWTPDPAPLWTDDFSDLASVLRGPWLKP